jgi:hypothetical protein
VPNLAALQRPPLCPEKDFRHHTHVVAQAVTLRRVKDDQYMGRPMVVLPPKDVSMDHLVFSEEEEAIYTAFEAQMQVLACSPSGIPASSCCIAVSLPLPCTVVSLPPKDVSFDHLVSSASLRGTDAGTSANPPALLLSCSLQGAHVTVLSHMRRSPCNDCPDEL